MADERGIAVKAASRRACRHAALYARLWARAAETVRPRRRSERWLRVPLDRHRGGRLPAALPERQQVVDRGKRPARAERRKRDRTDPVGDHQEACPARSPRRAPWVPPAVTRPARRIWQRSLLSSVTDRTLPLVESCRCYPPCGSGAL